jgi:hypothetical protein
LFSPCGFEALRNREIVTGGDAIKKQLINFVGKFYFAKSDKK